MIKDKKLYRVLTDRMKAQGWDNNTHFARSSGIPYSRETTSRAFEKHATREIANDTLATILKYLNYTPAEIKEILKKYTDDTQIWPMIQIDGPELSNKEQAFLAMIRELSEPVYVDFLANQFEVLGKAAGKEKVFADHLVVVRRHERKK